MSVKTNNTGSVQTDSGVRRVTRSVRIGNVFVGGDNPVRIQSMTCTPTDDVDATVKQTIELAEAGCEIVRFTVQGIKEAKACERIKDKLVQLGYDIPLVADIHFFPQAAMHVADFVEKVRINPGNYVDKRYLFDHQKNWTEELFAKGYEKIQDKFTPLVEKCKRLGKAMRIGVNHGSLSERVLQKFGNTPKGMVFSALEYTQVCVDNDYHDIVYSMKSSNPVTMVEAYRLLAEELDARGWNYPLHLGVTEAGTGSDGEIKSAIGIGALLLDGLGDTIRCSITGDPTIEIPVCKNILKTTTGYWSQKDYIPIVYRSYQEDLTAKVFPLSLALTSSQVDSPNFLKNLGISGSEESGYKKVSATPDALIVPQSLENHKALAETSKLGIRTKRLEDISIISLEDPMWESKALASPRIHFKPCKDLVASLREFCQWQNKIKHNVPLTLFVDVDQYDREDLISRLSTELGCVLLDSMADGLILYSETISPALLSYLGFSILQGTRKRIALREIISCPSCGRTLFDLPTVTERVQKITKHLPGLKIAVMGCIVNGPGEMADADFGFVGSKPGMIDLYVKHKPVRTLIPMDEAEEALIALLKEYNVWKDPES